MARILVVDDVKFISQMLKAVFEEKGHQVSTASNGVEALAKAREEQPELVLLDIAMPQMDGIEVTRHLKADNSTKPIPVIVVSAKNDKSTIAEAYAAGAADFVFKPFNNEELLAKVGELLGGQRMNFSTEIKRGIPVVSVLPPELDESGAEQLRLALETVRGGGGRPMVVDLTRVKRTAIQVADTLLAVEKELASQGGRLAVVASSRVMGLRAMRAKIEAALKVHETVDEAVEDVRSTLGESKIMRLVTGPAKAESGAARIKDAKHGLVLESRENLTLVWLKRKDLGGNVFEFLSEVLPKNSKNVWVDFREVKEFSPKDLGGLGQFAKNLKSDNRNLLLVNPVPLLVEALQKMGLGGLVTQMDAAPANSGIGPSTATSS